MSHTEPIMWSVVSVTYVTFVYFIYQFARFNAARGTLAWLAQFAVMGWNWVIAIAAIVYYTGETKTASNRNSLRAVWVLCLLWIMTGMVTVNTLIKMWYHRNDAGNMWESVETNPGDMEKRMVYFQSKTATAEDKKKAEERAAKYLVGYDLHRIFAHHGGDFFSLKFRQYGWLLTGVFVVLLVFVAYFSIALDSPESGQFVTYYGKINFSAAVFLCAWVFYAAANSIDHVFVVFRDYENVLTYVGENSAWYGGLHTQPLLALVPVSVIVSVNFILVGSLFVFFNNYAQLFFALLFWVAFPMFGCALHQTFAAWTEHFQLGVMFWAQLYYVFPALFQIARSTSDFSASSLSTQSELHLSFPSIDNDTAMYYRSNWNGDNTYIGFEHTRAVEVIISFYSIISISLGVLLMDGVAKYTVGNPLLSFPQYFGRQTIQFAKKAAKALGKDGRV